MNEEKRPYDDIEKYGGMMQVSTPCSHFERRFDFDTFTMSDYSSCENCRNLTAENRCRYR